MTVQLHRPAFPHLPDEISFSIVDSDGIGVTIHPWDRAEYTNPREVAITTGFLSDDDEAKVAIVDRAEFIDGLLAVFPELARADASVPR